MSRIPCLSCKNLASKVHDSDTLGGTLPSTGRRKNNSAGHGIHCQPWLLFYFIHNKSGVTLSTLKKITDQPAVIMCNSMKRLVKIVKRFCKTKIIVHLYICQIFWQCCTDAPLVRAERRSSCKTMSIWRMEKMNFHRNKWNIFGILIFLWFVIFWKI